MFTANHVLGVRNCPRDRTELSIVFVLIYLKCRCRYVTNNQDVELDPKNESDWVHIESTWISVRPSPADSKNRPTNCWILLIGGQILIKLGPNCIKLGPNCIKLGPNCITLGPNCIELHHIWSELHQIRSELHQIRSWGTCKEP